MSSLKTNVTAIVDLLVGKDYSAIEQLSHGNRLSAQELKKAVEDYGRVICKPGEDWWKSVQVTPVDNKTERTFHVAAPLWAEEEGRSDLTFELELVETAQGTYDTKVENLHVL